MSKEKPYAVRKHSGEFWDFLDGYGFWALDISDCPTTTSKEKAEKVAANHNGHVVTLVEEPKKVVLSEKQAKIVEGARDGHHPASGISLSGDNDEELLMNAYVNGYTVAKEKKYRVLAPKSWWQSEDKPKYMHRTFGISAYRGAGEDSVFTQQQLDIYELNGAPFTKEEVTDDAD